MDELSHVADKTDLQTAPKPLKPPLPLWVTRNKLRLFLVALTIAAGMGRTSVIKSGASTAPSNSSKQASKPATRPNGKPAAIGLFIVAVVGCSSDPPAVFEPTDWDRALAALESGNLQRARTEALKVTEEDPNWADCQVLLGRVELELGNPQKAVEYFRSIPRDGSEVSIQAAYGAAPNEQSLGQLSRAIASYEYILAHQP